MRISCPQCASKFNLPDKLAKPGAKLRCAVCKNVFQLPGDKPEEQPLSMPARKKSGALKWTLVACCLLLLAAAGGAGWYYFLRTSPPPPLQEETAKKVELLTMRNVRQYNLLNDKIGKIFVIEGKVVNEFPEPKEFIELEGAIYDNERKPIEAKRQLAGSQLSLFQLQVLSEKEMESFLNNKMEILANNTNVPPGGEVPFMILFYDPPENVSEFGVKIVDARDAGSAP
ncbi:MAG: zinc-ribbon domain-containing protein [Desulfovibrio sp.]|nr:zinc-ribbon domain-containing protein [Desulfovibrio sp.]